MAFGAEAMGVVYFAAVKFAGYTAAGYFLRRKYPEAIVSPFVIGFVRTLIGLVAGAAVMLLVSRLDIAGGGFGFYLLLLPVRIAEWLLVLWLFFERGDWQWSRALGWATLGFAWSSLLDLPAVLSAFLLPGGVWIC